MILDSRNADWVFWGGLALAIGLFGGMLYATFSIAPVEARMRIIQRRWNCRLRRCGS